MIIAGDFSLQSPKKYVHVTVLVVLHGKKTIWNVPDILIKQFEGDFFYSIKIVQFDQAGGRQ